MEIEVVFSLNAHETAYYFLPIYCRLSSASLFPSLPNPRAFDLSLKHSELTCFWDFLAPFPHSSASLILVILKALYVFTQVPLFKQNIKFLTLFLNILFKAIFMYAATYSSYLTFATGSCVSSSTGKKKYLQKNDFENSSIMNSQVSKKRSLFQ